MSTLVETTDLILGHFMPLWKAQTPPVIGYVPEIVLEWIQRNNQPETKKKAFGRFLIRHVGGQQATLSGHPGSRFTHAGVVIIQMLTPIEDAANFAKAQQLAQVALSAFQGQAIKDIWFRNVRYTEIGRDGIFYQINVTAEFHRTEIA